MKFTVTDAHGRPVEFECADTLESRWTSEAILKGKTYPVLPFVEDVRVVLDAGANCGATSVHLAHHHPDATVHAFEPGSEALGYLRRNVAALPNVVVHPFGLHSVDAELELHLASDDLGQSSVLHPPAASDGRSETVQVRAAGPWAEAEGIERIDVLKVDVEGCEVEVLRSLGRYLPDVKVLYVEYDSRAARREIFELLDRTHELYFSMLMAMDQGECVFLRKDLAERDVATESMRDLFTLVTST